MYYGNDDVFGRCYEVYGIVYFFYYFIWNFLVGNIVVLWNFYGVEYCYLNVLFVDYSKRGGGIEESSIWMCCDGLFVCID